MSRAIIVMGVSGCGKSTLGQALAQALGYVFIEGDDLHPPANIAKMAAGIALDDDDRAPFLANVAAAMAAARDRGVVGSCSALKRRYRALIRERVGDVVFVMPMLSEAALIARMAARRDHFMPVSLLVSQLAALEPPDADETAILVDGAVSVERQVAQVIATLERISRDN